MCVAIGCSEDFTVVEWRDHLVCCGLIPSYFDKSVTLLGYKSLEGKFDAYFVVKKSRFPTLSLHDRASVMISNMAFEVCMLQPHLGSACLLMYTSGWNFTHTQTMAGKVCASLQALTT